MQKIHRHGASESERTNLSGALNSVRLDDIRVFLEIAKQGSLRSAATELSTSPNSLTRRLDAFEHAIQQQLFVRGTAGMSMTKEGRDLLERAKEFDLEAQGLMSHLSGLRKNRRKKVVVYVTEGLGTFWLMPRLVEFYEKHPNILIDFRCQMKPADFTCDDVDVAVQLDSPDFESVSSECIGHLHIMLFSSVKYHHEHGSPQAVSELKNYHYVEQLSEQLAQKGVEEYIPNAREDFVSMQTNTSSSHAYAIARGAGIGPLPSYARAITTQLIPVCREFGFSREIFLVSDTKKKQPSHVKTVVKWIEKSFDSKKYPWFAEELIHPDEFEKDLNDGNIIDMFNRFE